MKIKIATIAEKMINVMYFFCTFCNLHHPHFAKNLFYLYMSYLI